MSVQLNEEQQRAVSHRNGALLVLAGAGAGKTRVIVERIAALIRSGVAPEKILAVTFTNKAAHEMLERVEKTVSEDRSLSPYDTPSTRPFVGTFHALSLHIIKTFHAELELPKRFTIYDRADSLRAAREAVKECGFDPKELEPRRVLSVMSRNKGADIDVERFRNEIAESYIDTSIAEVWEKYNAILKKEHALDFDDILVRALELIRNSKTAREHFQNAWEYIHVDEYQDTNHIQYELIKLLADTHRNIAVIGDADQNVYSWRGSSIKYILNFEHDYPDATLITLTQNYRSTKTIIAAANEAIKKNINRKEKTLVANAEDGEKIKVGGFADEVEEAEYVAKEARRIVKAGTPANDIAVLYRANFQSRTLEEAFLHADIPYQVLGTRFFERAEVKDALSYLRAAFNPRSVADVTRTINMPTRGIGKVTLQKVIDGKIDDLPDAQRGKVHAYFTLLNAIRTMVDTELPSDAVKKMLSMTGLMHLYESGDSEMQERFENLKELVSVASKYNHMSGGEGIEKLIEEAALQSDQDELSVREKAKQNGVKLMTVHAAKGLEFNTVFIVGLEDGLFPHTRDDDDGVDSEEERRLFYVAITRAEKKAYMTYALTRRIFGTRAMNAPSEFITELDADISEIISAPAYFEPPTRYIL